MQFGVWLTTRHSAFCPQIPTHGSLHFWFRQAKLAGHSLLLTHSGLQYGGVPTNSGKQEHEGEPFETLHWELGPHGDGSQGLVGSTGGSSKIINVNKPCTYNVGFLVLHNTHLTNGSPVWGVWQLQIGLWFTTWHFAPMPQVPGQGSIHFWLTHALSKLHSELVIHSGLQVGGEPI